MEDEGERTLLDLLPSPDAGPDALYARNVLLAEIEMALGELPPSQREVFLAHEIEGRSFADISAETGVSVDYAAVAKTLRRKTSAKPPAEDLRRIG